MAVLSLTRGLPGSGKTTWAKTLDSTWRVNRDDIRAMYTGVWDYRDEVMEALVTEVQKRMVLILLKANRDVVVDDTHMHLPHLTLWYGVVKNVTPRVEVRTMEFLHVPVDECVRRDALRPNPVGEDVIRGMYERYLAGQ